MTHLAEQLIETQKELREVKELLSALLGKGTLKKKTVADYKLAIKVSHIKKQL